MVSIDYVNRISDTTDVEQLKREMKSITLTLHYIEHNERARLELIRKLNIIVNRIVELRTTE